MEKQTRFEYNLKIIGKLKELIIKYPDLRFGQLLVDCNIIQLEYIGINEYIGAKDPFNEESEKTWERMLTSKLLKKKDYENVSSNISLLRL